MSAADQSIGKQLPYVPEWSSNISGRLYWKKWSLLYKWCYYSERYTMSSNDITLSGKLPTYFMSNITIEKLLKRFDEEHKIISYNKENKEVPL